MVKAFSNTSFNNPSTLRLLIVITIACGLLLRLLQFSANASLWLDELAVVRNIIHLPLKRLLFSPLEYDQMTPVGFLLVGRILSSFIADQDWVFRVIPIVSSILTLPLIYLIGRRTIGQLPAIVATALVALSPAIIKLSSLAKQYSSDIFICSVLIYGALRIMSGETDKRTSLFLLGLCSGILLFFSFPAVFVAFGLAVCVTGKWVFEKQSGCIQRVLALGLPLAACAGLASTLALQALSPRTASYQSWIWLNGYAPQSPVQWPAWLWKQFSVLCTRAFLGQGGEKFWIPVAAVLLALAITGCVALVRRKNSACLALMAPVVMAIAAAAAHTYPLQGRLAYFLTPCMAILIAFGASTIGKIMGRFFRHAVPAAYAAALAGTALALCASTPPYTTEEMRPLMKHLSEELQTTDTVYSYYAANQAVDYYGERFGITEWDAGTCHRSHPRAYLEELDAYRGLPRVWIIFTHVVPIYAEADVILGYLRTIGTEKKKIKQRGARAYLFDLSNPAMLSRATAENYTFKDNPVVNPRYACGDGPAAEWQRPGL